MEKNNIHQHLIVIVILLICSGMTLGHWTPGDDYKMHNPQEPNPTGWDICLIHQAVADDFECTETGSITDIHFWISWRGDLQDFSALTWGIQIFDDQDGQPGKSLWTWNPQDGMLNWEQYGEGDQGWHCPGTGLTKQNDHVDYYQVNITDLQNTFQQT